MGCDLQAIEDRISEISTELEGAYIAPVDEGNIRNIRTNIVELLSDATDYLSETYPEMTPWQKTKIVRGVNALYWDWLYLALNSIRLAVADPASVSPDNEYDEEIVRLSNNDLVRHIARIKGYLSEVD